MMRLRIYHESHYRLDAPARRLVQYLRLTPRADRGQNILRWSIDGPGRLTPWIDGYGNRAHLAAFHEAHDEVLIRVEGEAETQDLGGVLPLDDGLPPAMFLKETERTACDATMATIAQDYAARAQKDGAIAALHALMLGIADAMPYRAGATDAETTAAQAWALGCGVCQDHAHVFIALARRAGWPARYVSGYLHSSHAEMASHAWAEAFVKGLGWISFDPANRQCATDHYLRLAIGHDYGAAAPIAGRRAGGWGEELSVRLAVEQSQA